MLVNEKVFEIEECEDIFKYLDTLEVEYRKPYMRFGKTVHVPRGQASFTFNLIYTMTIKCQVVHLRI